MSAFVGRQKLGLFTIGDDLLNLQDGSEKTGFRIISSCSQLKSDWSIRNAGINRRVKWASGYN